jgi:hypothetical protein
MTLTYKEAINIAGKLSRPAKMPCPSWGIDPKHCAIGKKLRNQKGTTCSICYACKGNYNFPAVRNSQDVRFEGITHPKWVEAMVVSLTKEKLTHFRWFDSGDLQGRPHLLQIILIATQMPDINFWLPTQEHKLIRDCKHKIPSNLKIRLTNAIIDPDRELRNAPLVAEVHTKPTETNIDGWICPADTNGNKCGDCRACWDPKIKKVIYKKH